MINNSHALLCCCCEKMAQSTLFRIAATRCRSYFLKNAKKDKKPQMFIYKITESHKWAGSITINPSCLCQCCLHYFRFPQFEHLHIAPSCWKAKAETKTNLENKQSNMKGNLQFVWYAEKRDTRVWKHKWKQTLRWWPRWSRANNWGWTIIWWLFCRPLWCPVNNDCVNILVTKWNTKLTTEDQNCGMYTPSRWEGQFSIISICSNCFTNTLIWMFACTFSANPSF